MPNYSFKEKLNNRLLKFNAYLLGNSHKQRLLKQLITANNNIFDNVINFQSASDYSFNVALNLVLHDGIDCVIDVGANQGQFASQVLESGFQEQVISFEPQDSVFQKLERKSAAFRNWDVYELGISTIGGERNLNIFSGDQFSSMHEPSKGGLESESLHLSLKERVSIQPVRLDDFTEENYPKLISGGKKRLLKTDTQGHDLNVIASSEGILSIVRAIVIELGLIPIYENTPSFAESAEFLKNSGFAPMGFFSINNSAANFASVEMDGIFVRY